MHIRHDDAGRNATWFACSRLGSRLRECEEDPKETLNPLPRSGLGRLVWIRRAELDRRVLLEARLQLADDSHGGIGDPGVVSRNVALLLSVGEQIDDLRQR